ncbi:MAG TPA: 6-carboxytetrahydropterin synthase QueD [Acidobacteriota bacterium]|nr:6-carboxytetrahydropterin synthase QueD [Acidobacteriota bacterium]
MYQISKIFRFEAAHHLPNHDGKCQRVHGHSWVATVTVACPRLVRQGSKQGMVMDFGDLKAVVQPIIDQYLDHWDLNETIPVYPTSENIACWLFERINHHQDLGNVVRLVSVEINETCTSACVYTEETL